MANRHKEVAMRSYDILLTDRQKDGRTICSHKVAEAT